MPSPIGHSLGALAAGWIVAKPEAERRALVRQAGILAMISVAPDLDLLVGRHSMETHSIGAALLAAGIAGWLRWPVARTRLRIFAAVGLAWLSHPLLDLMAPDTSPPLGVMLFWPVSASYVYPDLSVFAPISRRYWLDGFVAHNLGAIVREIAILLPIAGVILAVRGPSRRTTRDEQLSANPGGPSIDGRSQ